MLYPGSNGVHAGLFVVFRVWCVHVKHGPSERQGVPVKGAQRVVRLHLALPVQVLLVAKRCGVGQPALLKHGLPETVHVGVCVVECDVTDHPRVLNEFNADAKHTGERLGVLERPPSLSLSCFSVAPDGR